MHLSIISLGDGGGGLPPGIRFFFFLEKMSLIPYYN